MKLFNKIRKIFSFIQPPTETAVFERWQAQGINQNGEWFTETFNWVRANALNCPGYEYLMIDIKRDGYFSGDNENTIYPLNGLYRISWHKLNTIIGEIPYKSYNFKIIYNDEELEEILRKGRKRME